jgi:hypothetical protein
VPLIEEVFKPVGVWLLIGRRWRPAAGFAAGALSGAGYALFESLALSSRGIEWATLATARMGTGVIHIFTAALTGWGLVMAWERRRFVTLGLAYLAAVLIHGLWNGLTLFSTYAALAKMQTFPLEMPRLVRLGSVAPYGLVALAVVALFSLLWANRALARSLAAPRASDAGLQPSPDSFHDGGPQGNPDGSML